MARWLEQFTPNEYVSTVRHIDLDKLWREGKRAILTDLDNTLVAWNDPSLPNSLAEWIQKVREKGFQICIVSNNKGPRVQAFADLAGIPAVSGAKKPKPEAFMKAVRQLGVEASQTVMVGDQLLTDVRGGNRCGLYTILVLPIHPNEWWGTKILRFFEKRVMKMLIRRGLQVPARHDG
jgi:uncharacterized protein